MNLALDSKIHVMKYLIILILLLSTIQLNAQKPITAEEWQNDLRFLQNAIHESFPFLFKKTTVVEFDTAVNTLYNNIPNLEAHEVVVGFSRLIALFKYGHTNMSFRIPSVQFHELPLKIYEFSDGIYITGIHKDYNNIQGSKIIEIEGQPIADVLKAIYPVVPVENEYYFKAYGISYAMIPEVLHAQGITDEFKQTISFTLAKEGKLFVTNITAVAADTNFPLQYGQVKANSDWVSARNLNQNPLYLKHLAKRYYYEYLPKDNLAYVRYSQIFDDDTETIVSFFKRVFEFIDTNSVDRLVIDLRLNGGGNNYNNKTVITSILEQKSINQKGKLFVIIGRRTFSAAQNLVNELDNYTNAIFLGEPTAENINFYGDSKTLMLPKSKLNVYLSFAWWQDKPQWENKPYTSPDIPVELSFNDYVSNTDPVLNKILSLPQND